MSKPLRFPVRPRREVNEYVHEWSRQRDAENTAWLESLYQEGYKKAPQYESTKDAIAMMTGKAALLMASRATEKKIAPELKLKDAIEIMAEYAAFTVDDRGEKPALLTYDYDRKVYRHDSILLAEYIMALMKVVSRNDVATCELSLIAMKTHLAPYNPPPSYKVAVGNGVFNYMTRRLEPASPHVTVTEHIRTPYEESSYDPYTPEHKGRTFTSFVAELANFKPDREKLIRQICTSIVTGRAVAPSLFMVVGRGGDGKSTFFTLLVNTIGKENTAFVNFSQVGQEDKMLEIIGKKMVLGMDNDAGLYIKHTAALKSIASHEYLTFSRKYMDALSAKFNGTFVQLCNDTPRFAETGASMLRRIVAVKAENSHYVQGSEDRSVDILIAEPEFAKHTLYSILNQPLYRDFNDCDRDMIEAALEVEDVLGQFMQEMESLGVFSEVNELIPVNHLFGAYREWLSITNPSTTSLSSRSFAAKITTYMDDMGYKLSTRYQGVRASAIEEMTNYHHSCFGPHAQGATIDSLIKVDAVTAIFEKTKKAVDARNTARHDQECHALEFFGYVSDFTDWLAAHHPQVDVWEGSGDTTATPATYSRNHTPEPVAPPKPVPRDTPPCDVRHAWSQGDGKALTRYAQWAYGHTKEPDGMPEKIDFASQVAKEIRLVESIVKQTSNASWFARIEDVKDTRQGSVRQWKLLGEFVERMAADC